MCCFNARNPQQRPAVGNFPSMLILGICLIFFGFSRDADADLILELTSPAEWNVDLQPEGFDIGIEVYSNAMVPNDNLMNSFAIGIRFVPVDDAVGGLRVLSTSNSFGDRVFPTYNVVPALSEGVQTFSADNLVDANTNFVGDNVLIPALGRTLFIAKVAAVAGQTPLGKYDIVLDRELTGYFTETFDELKFSNVPRPEFADPPRVGVRLGTISVTAIPEPSSLLVAAIATTMMSVRWRPRRGVLCK